MADSALKTCYICKQHLPRVDFFRSRRRPDGLYPYCRRCDSVKRAAAKASDPIRAEAARQAKRAYDARYHEANGDRRRAQAVEYYYRNREAAKERVRAWQIANPEIVGAYKQTSKAKRRAVEREGMTGRELLAWKRAQPKVCHWCHIDCADAYHIDHYLALSRGGRHEPDNLVISCPTCNLEKHAKDPEAFAAEKAERLRCGVEELEAAA